MTRYLASWLFSLPPILLGASVVAFCLIRLQFAKFQ